MFSTLKAELIQSGLEAPIYTWVRGGSESIRNDDAYRLILGCPQEDGIDGNEIITINKDKSIVFNGEVSLANVSLGDNSVQGNALLDGTLNYEKFSQKCLETLRENLIKDSEGTSILQAYVRQEPLSTEKDFEHRSIEYCYGKEEEHKELIAPHLLRKLWMWNGTSEDANDVALPALTDYTINLSNRLDESYLGLTAKTLEERLATDKTGILYFIANNFVELISQAIKMMPAERKAEILMSLGMADGSISIDTSNLVSFDENGNINVPNAKIICKGVEASESVTAPVVNATEGLQMVLPDGTPIDMTRVAIYDENGNLNVAGDITAVNGTFSGKLNAKGAASFKTVNATGGITTTTLTVKNNLNLADGCVFDGGNATIVANTISADTMNVTNKLNIPDTSSFVSEQDLVDTIKSMLSESDIGGDEPPVIFKTVSTTETE